MVTSALGVPMADELHIDTFKSVISGLLGLISSVGWFWLKRITGRLDDIEDDLSERNTRISVLETQNDTVNRRLDRIETKLDILIEKKN